MKEQIIKILTELRPEFDFTQEGVNFIEEGMLDSFDVVSLVSDIEEEFGVLIDGTEILPENFCTVESIEALIKKNIPYFSGSVGLDDGSFGPFLKNTKEKKAVLKKLETIVPHIKYNNMCLSSFGPTNSIIADAMAKEILFFLLKCPKEIQSYSKQVIVRF